jgi:hypothetical protein
MFETKSNQKSISDHGESAPTLMCEVANPSYQYRDDYHRVYHDDGKAAARRSCRHIQRHPVWMAL